MTRMRSEKEGPMGGLLKNPGYRERLLDREVGVLMEMFGAVLDGLDGLDGLRLRARVVAVDAANLPTSFLRQPRERTTAWR